MFYINTCRLIAVNIDYDLYINDESHSSSVALAAPFVLNTNSLSIALWVNTMLPILKGVFFTLYSVESAHLPIGKQVLVQADETGVLVSFSQIRPMMYSYAI
ncbi:fibropellin-1 [Caerostris extrusa]|uniref:Fibropellin-1 n=1 Tax=Caerostris extrusa TaxID=172846 RepID=A0AAV4XEZ7_CAEEX|nr:fibropellin-1 [Caerostris extrusa]